MFNSHFLQGPIVSDRHRQPQHKGHDPQRQEQGLGSFIIKWHNRTKPEVSCSEHRLLSVGALDQNRRPALFEGDIILSSQMHRRFWTSLHQTWSAVPILSFNLSESIDAGVCHPNSFKHGTHSYPAFGPATSTSSTTVAGSQSGRYPQVARNHENSAPRQTEKSHRSTQHASQVDIYFRAAREPIQCAWQSISLGRGSSI